jgi:SSS family transporter
MTTLDWTIVGLYLAAVLGMSAWVARGQKSNADYYVGGRKLPWWALAMSIMATQSSANSFLGIPAFVALRPGGGVKWLQYELAVPLAMIVIMAVLVPILRSLELISLYEYLEHRFDRRTRLFMSGVFILSRSIATGVGLYAASVVLSATLGFPIWACILLMSVITIFYDTIGGMAAVVWTDVIQLTVLLVGVVTCVVISVRDVGGIGAALAAHDPARLAGVDWSTGIGDGSKAPLWGFLIGGLVLYISYYGVDQSQAQRSLAAPSIDLAKRSLLFNGLARFPLTVCYIVMGLALGAAYAHSPELRAAVPTDKFNYLVPEYVLLRVPPGLKGILFAAILSASMSSVDASLNSLSAAVMRDFVEPLVPAHRHLFASKATTAALGCAIMVAALFVGEMSPTVVESINTIGSVFYGPILAAFGLGMLDRRARGEGVLAGVAAGVGTNLVLWQTLKNDLFWMWWNVTGLVVAVLVAAVVSRMLPAKAAPNRLAVSISWSEFKVRERPWFGWYAFLILYFVALCVVAANSEAILRAFG